MTSEIKKIIDRAEDCLSDAVFNFEHNRFQVAINRSYYCMFDCISALLHHKDIFVKTHQGSHLKFAEHYIKPGLLDISLAKMLSKVFGLRQSSDYDFEFEPDADDITAALDHARTFLAATKGYFAALT